MGTIRVLVSGACGSMGSHVCRAVNNADDMELVAAVDPAGVGSKLGSVVPKLTQQAAELTVWAGVKAAIQGASPDVMVDFTAPSVVMANIETALKAGVACVVGTTGFTDEDMATIDQMAHATNTPCFVAANFSIGAVLMMKFAAEAVNSFDYAEIIERHHDRKKDAPSGTAVKTAQMMAEARKGSPLSVVPTERFNVEDSRGGVLRGIPIHAVRLPGYVANQEVLFGGPGETLKISHETTSRECFMPGVILAIRALNSLEGLTYGLDKIIFDG